MYCRSRICFSDPHVKGEEQFQRQLNLNTRKIYRQNYFKLVALFWRPALCFQSCSMNWQISCVFWQVHIYSLGMALFWGADHEVPQSQVTFYLVLFNIAASDLIVWTNLHLGSHDKVSWWGTEKWDSIPVLGACSREAWEGWWWCPLAERSCWCYISVGFSEDISGLVYPVVSQAESQ